jgi:hypothetical protein
MCVKRRKYIVCINLSGLHVKSVKKKDTVSMGAGRTVAKNVEEFVFAHMGSVQITAKNVEENQFVCMVGAKQCA